MDFDSLGNDLTRSLDAAVASTVRAFDADRILADVDQTVKSRTARGEYLPGSTAGASRYRSAAHKRRREQRGLQTETADLFFSGDMLGATRGEATRDADEVRMVYGYIPGQSEEQAMTIAGYHNNTGAGPGGVIRRFVGLLPDEKDRIVGNAQRHADELFRQAMR